MSVNENRDLSSKYFVFACSTGNWDMHSTLYWLRRRHTKWGRFCSRLTQGLKLTASYLNTSPLSEIQLKIRRFNNWTLISLKNYAACVKDVGIPFDLGRQNTRALSVRVCWHCSKDGSKQYWNLYNTGKRQNTGLRFQEFQFPRSSITW